MTALFAGAAWPAEAPATGSPQAQLRVGERIYREGITGSGAPLRATVLGGVPLPPGQGACVTCHRPSGMGSIEGQTAVSPVVGAALYRPGSMLTQAFGPSFARKLRRPAYSDETLATAIRDGVDPAGGGIVAPMPQFALGDRDMAALIAYLKSLSVDASPGVDEREIHFATVVTAGVAPEKRRALVDTLEAFMRERNGGGRFESREGQGPGWTVRERRRWRLHVWELTGPPEEWPRQLAEHYRRQPAFAVLGGLAAGSWRPMHDFCETNRMPCLFPSTDLPVVAGTSRYSVYFSQGMTLEAEALAQHLAEAGPVSAVLQAVDGDPRSVAAAAALRRALAQRGLPAPEEVRLPGAADGVFWERLLQGRQWISLVLWQGGGVDLGPLAAQAGALDRIVVSSSLADRWPTVPGALDGKVLAIHPFAAPERRERQLARLRAWLRLRGVAPGDERVQADAYFAANALALGFMQLADNLSRDYLLERIEDMDENVASESVYPRVTLGPGQRFASKGAYVLNLPAGGAMPTVGGWMLP